ncbi:MAG: hypothetical protein HY420_00045 [Candidatus Kerfeldbacteria bacterium]|nr:hypothetical protein [Candidatus Kerfeldbacteria bacterium]
MARRGRREDRTPEPEPATDPSPAPPVASPTPGQNPRSEGAIPDDVERAGLFAGIAAFFTALLGNRRGRTTITEGIREGFGWTGQGFKFLADETGPINNFLRDDVNPALDGHLNNVRALRQRMELARRQPRNFLGIRRRTP